MPCSPAIAVQLGDEAGLADARLADDGQELRRALRHDARERVAQAPELSARPISGWSSRRPIAGASGSTLSSRKPPSASADGARGVTHHLPGRLGEPDLAARARARQPLGHGHRLADDRSGVGRAARRDDLAGADAGARPQAERQLLDPGAELRRGAEGALRVVLVRDRDAEHRQERVVAQLDDAAVTAGAHRASGVVEALDHRPQRFGVGARRRFGAGQLGEDARHPATGVGRDRRALAAAATGSGTSWRRIADSSARSSGEGSIPSPSTSARCASRYAASASACRPLR